MRDFDNISCGGPRLLSHNGFIFHSHGTCLAGDSIAVLVRTPVTHSAWDSLVRLRIKNTLSPSIEMPGFWVDPTGDTLVIFQNRQTSHVNFSRKIDLYALNLRTREVAWKIDSLDPQGHSNVSPPLVWQDKIYFQGFHTVYCVDAATGALVWKQVLHNLYEQLLSCNMLLVDQKLLVRSGYGHFMAFDPNTGSLLWKNTELTGTSPNMMAHNGVVYFAGPKGAIHGYDLNSGKKLASVVSPNKGNNGNSGFINEIAIDRGLGHIYTSDSYATFCYKILR